MGQTNSTITKDDLPAEVVSYIDSLEAAVDDLTEKVTKAEQEVQKAQKEAQDAKDISKIDQTDPKAVFEAALAKADPMVAAVMKRQQEQLDEAERVAKAERDARLTAQYVSKAEALPMISEDKAGLATLLRTMADKLTPEEVEKVETILKAANEQIAKGDLFSEFGKGGAETTIAKSVEAQAAELRKNNPKLTKEQAIAQVYEDNPDLYLAELKEG